MSAFLNGSPGSHPHADRPNWRPGDDDIDELKLQKLTDALRNGISERELAKLLGTSRTAHWRWRTMAQIPRGLSERLLKAHVGMRALIFIGRIWVDPDNAPKAEVERCPNCGHVLLVRNKGLLRALDIMKQWWAEGRPEPTPGFWGDDEPHCAEQEARKS
jgi:hypothetical protein